MDESFSLRFSRTAPSVVSFLDLCFRGDDEEDEDLDEDFVLGLLNESPPLLPPLLLLFLGLVVE